MKFVNFVQHILLVMLLAVIIVQAIFARQPVSPVVVDQQDTCHQQDIELQLLRSRNGRCEYMLSRCLEEPPSMFENK